MIIEHIEVKKADEKNEPLELHNGLLQKNLTEAIFLLAPAANMLGASQFFIGYMKWQHAVNLEYIRERDPIIIFRPA